MVYFFLTYGPDTWGKLIRCSAQIMKMKKIRREKKKKEKEKEVEEKGSIARKAQGI